MSAVCTPEDLIAMPAEAHAKALRLHSPCGRPRPATLDVSAETGSGWVRDPGRRRSSRSTTGYLTSMRIGGGVHVFESRLERDCQIVLDGDHGIIFQTQPRTFGWTDGDRRRRWTPDLRITVLRDGAIIYVEVKPSAKVARSPDLGGRLPGMVASCAAEGAGFALLTEREIRGGHALRVARRLRSAAHRCDEPTVARLLDVLSAVRWPGPLGSIQALFPKAADRFALLGLIGRGLLTADLSLGLGPDTLVSEGPQPWR